MILNAYLRTIVYIFAYYISNTSQFGPNEDNDSTWELTSNFFTNLHFHPWLAGKNFSQLEKAFVDKQIENYMSLVENSQENVRVKRNVDNFDLDDKGVFKFKGFHHKYTVPTTFSLNVELFIIPNREQGKDIFAASLECETVDCENFAAWFELYVLIDNKKFEKIHKIPVNRGKTLKIFTIHNLCYFILVQETQDSSDTATVYEFNLVNEIIFRQNINVPKVTHTSIWKQTKDIYLAFSLKGNNGNNNINCPVFKWIGNHFDLVHQLDSVNAKKIIPFKIGNHYFLTILTDNYHGEESEEFSDIYKYNVNTESFELYQKISTKAPFDCIHFYYHKNGLQEHFLVFGNQGINENTESIIYKYVDNYFLPFQRLFIKKAKNWNIIIGAAGELLLLVICEKGNKYYQYDGWRFAELRNDSFISGDAKILNSYHLKGLSYVVTFDERKEERSINVQTPIFERESIINDYEHSLEIWCLNTLKGIERENLQGMHKKLEKMPKKSDEDIVINGNVSFTSLVVKNLHSFEVNDLNDKALDMEELENMRAMERKLIDQFIRLESRNSKRIRRGTLGFESVFNNLSAYKIKVINGTVNIANLTIDYINDNKINDFFQNIMPIDNDILVTTDITFNNLTITDDLLNVKYVNGRPANSMLKEDKLDGVQNLQINGHVTFEQGVLVDGLIGGIPVDENSLLTHSDGQRLSGDLRLLHVNAEKLEYSPGTVQELNTLQVPSLILRGFINDIHMDTLNEYALKTENNSFINGYLEFETLRVKNFIANGFVSDVRVPEELVLIDGCASKHMCTVQGDVAFLQDVTVNGNVQVHNLINSVPIVNGKLQVLLKNITEKQFVNGIKAFDHLELKRPITLHGRIKSASMEKMKPVRMIEDGLELNEDVMITDVTVENFVKAFDFVDANNANNSLRRLFEHGLKLNESDVFMNMRFKHTLTVDSIDVDSINKIDPQSWLLMDDSITQVVQGSKWFQGDVHVTNKSKVLSLNDINVAELDKDIMKINGDQNITGKHFIKNIKANRILFKDFTFAKNLDDIVTLDGDQYFTETVTINVPLEIRELNAKNINVTKKLNEVDIDSLLSDLVLADTTASSQAPLYIFGAKTFASNLTIKYLNVFTNVENNEIEEKSGTEAYVINGSLKLPKLRVENILLKNNHTLNGISSDDLHESKWLMKEGDQIINGNVIFEAVEVLDQVYSQFGKINNIRVEDIARHTIKINEDYNFLTDVDFSYGMQSLSDVSLQGNLGDQSINKIIQNAVANDKFVDLNFIKFRDTVTVKGNLILDGHISNLNVTELCRYANPAYNERIPHLIINGSAYFAKGPYLKSINDVNVKDVLKNAWLKNEETELNGNVEFQSIIFQDKIKVNGLVNGVDIKWLKENYFSRTKTQTITSTLNFKDGIIFDGPLSVSRVNVGDKFANINMNDFLKSVLVNNTDQVFDNVVRIDDCTILNLYGNYTINSYNFLEDLMRYDVQYNYVTGYKTVKNIQTTNLNVPADVQVQNVYLHKFLADSVSITGNHKISGNKLFHNETIFKSIGLKQLLNNIKFDENNIMLKSIPQFISGFKAFTNISGGLIFNKLYTNKQINNIYAQDLITNQVYQDEEISAVFSPIVFNKNLQSVNANFVGLYNNVNMSKLMFDIENNMIPYTFKDKYELLLEQSLKIGNSLSLQAYFLKNFVVSQLFPGVTKIVPLNSLSNSGFNDLCFLIKKNNISIVSFLTWNDAQEQYNIDESMPTIEFDRNIYFLEKLTLSGHEYIYFESKSTIQQENNLSENYLGKFYRKEQSLKQFQHVQEILTNKTTSLTYFVLREENRSCVLLLMSMNNYADIYCENLTKNDHLSIFQRINLRNTSIQVLSITIDATPYIIIAKEKQHVEIWKYDSDRRLFVLKQIISAEIPISVTVVEYNNQIYLAVASGHFQNTIFRGFINIRRYNRDIGLFEMLQQIDLEFPTFVKYSVLPTKELVLYVLTNNPSQPFMVFMYQGITGFNVKVAESTLSKYDSLEPFTSQNGLHYIILSNQNESRILQAVFHGHSWISHQSETTP